MMNLVDDFIRKLIRFLAKCTHREIGVSVEETIIQFVKFGLVGVSNTLISYVLYVVSLLLLRRIPGLEAINYILAQVVAFVLSVLWSFYWNNRLVFKQKEGQQRTIIRTLLKTYVSYSFTGLFLNSILLVLWVQFLGISEFIAPIINLLISVPLNFVINKFWAFRS
jgi:putative flippase GtrA